VEGRECGMAVDSVADAVEKAREETRRAATGLVTARRGSSFHYPFDSAVPNRNYGLAGVPEFHVFRATILLAALPDFS